MNFAVLTATLKRDYDWYSIDNSFIPIAETLWSKWHNEVYDGAWFGLTTQNGQTFFLAGNIPTKRRDRNMRNIVDYIVLQSETPEDRKQLTLLTADLLSSRQDINDVTSPFVQWVDSICFPLAETGDCNYTSFPIQETGFATKSDMPIGRFEYPLNSMSERNNAAKAFGSLLENQEDFLVGCIQYSVEEILAKIENDLSPNAQIAIFSPKTTSKKEIKSQTVPSTFKPKFNPWLIGLVVFLIPVISSFHLWNQNSKMANQIQDLTNQVQDLTTQNQNLTNQVAKMDTTLKGYSTEIQKKNVEIQKWKEDYNNLQENFKNTLAAKNQEIREIQQTIQRYEADLKAKDVVIDELKKQINSPKELPPPPTTPADSNPVNPVNSDSVVE